MRYVTKVAQGAAIIVIGAKERTCRSLTTFHLGMSHEPPITADNALPNCAAAELVRFPNKGFTVSFIS